ncbi:DUF3850 domain-containing protein [Brucella sp. 458]|uniref:DUF3850 domain-containing protein n=1 Tax=Brucella sp. 458 TaxID=2821140 RepID=UPI001AE040E0|nr:DUF3850 domain-containing protein [Brucella sp. 458]QTO00531.1 DUF3850 domain-containing protein [Brucella sp. 458]
MVKSNIPTHQEATVMASEHTLKIDAQPMEDLLSGAKTGEVRKDDRGFQVGDTVRLTCADGRTVYRVISHIQRGYGLPDGICVLSYTIPAPVDANPLASNPVDDKIAPDTDGNAPAATDTVLKTVGYVCTTFVTDRRFKYDEIFRVVRTPDNWTELVTRSQAEELLAAERALADTATRQNALLWKRNEALEAKLAAAEKALNQLRCDCQEPINMYERNGPEFTSPHGNEYESASYVMAKFAELVASIDEVRAALRERE